VPENQPPSPADPASPRRGNDEQTAAIGGDPVSRPPRPRPPATGAPPEVPWWQEIYQRSPQRPRGHIQQSGYPPSHPAPQTRPPAPRQGPDWYQQPPVRSSQPTRQPVSPPRSAPPQPAAAAPQRRCTKRRLLIVGGITVVAIEAVALAVGLGLLGTFKTTELDVTNVEAGVAQVLADPVDGYGAESVSSVHCNGGRNLEVEKGSSFTCQAVVNGKQSQVAAVIVDDDGTYEVDWPR
jgi:Domain of unknown function (DUF4333)